MRKILLLIVTIVVVIAIYKSVWRNSGSARPGASSAGVHGVAPDFSLEGLDGQPVVFSSYKGKVVLLNFWATWCTPCRGEIPRFVNFQDRYGQQGLQVLGISMDDSPKPVRQFYNEMKMNYPVAIGTEHVAESFGGVLGLPITFLIGRDGRIQAKHTGEVDLSVLEQEITNLLQAK